MKQIHSGFPATGLAALTTALQTTPAGAEGPYMSPVPQTDAWNVVYAYVLVDASNYTLTSTAGGGTAIVVTNGQLN